MPTIIDGMHRIMQNMEECSCKRGEKVFFICKKAACPSYKLQQFYCLSCAGEGSHDHMPVAIEKENRERDNEWTTFVDKVYATLSQAKEKFSPLQNVVQYFDINLK